MEKIVRTLRCKNVNIPGTLGKLTTTIGRLGVDIGNVTTVHLALIIRSGTLTCFSKAKNTLKK